MLAQDWHEHQKCGALSLQLQPSLPYRQMMGSSRLPNNGHGCAAPLFWVLLKGHAASVIAAPPQLSRASCARGIVGRASLGC